LDEVTVNLLPDDDETLGLKGKTAMKWDSKKKRYMLKKIDKEGKVMKEKRNEAGSKISKRKEEKSQKDSIYKKWMKRTHLKLQNSGEVEDTKAI